MEIKFPSSFLRILILIINIVIYDSSFLSFGINQFNNFIYLEKLLDYASQTYTQRCTFTEGPSCFFIENMRSKIYEQENNIEEEIDEENNNNINYKKEQIIDTTILDLDNDWMKFFIKSKKIGLLNSITELSVYITQYKNNILSNSEDPKVLQPLTLKLGLTFESYDDTTIKGDIYAYPSKPVHFITETIYIEIVGKLRMHYGEDLGLTDQSKYPTKTFGIIESNNLVIKLGGKQFICESFFLRLRDMSIKNIKVEGYLGNIKAFSMTRDINPLIDKEWIKIELPNTKIDRILLPGGIDVDNFKFKIETYQHYDISAHFHSKYEKSQEELINDNDI
jgi:hypothetical protein